MLTEWFYEKDGESCGPVSSPELKKMADSGDISSRTLIWKEGLADWVSADTAKGLFASTDKPASASLRTHKTRPRNIGRRTLLVIAFVTTSILIVLVYGGLALRTAMPYLTAIPSTFKSVRQNVQQRTFSIGGSVGVFHTRQITVKDNWRITWNFSDCDDYDSISVWDGKRAIANINIKNSQRTKTVPYVGSVEIAHGGTYVIQIISTEGNWTMLASGEEPGAAKNGIDVQFGDDKYMGGFLESGGMGDK
jgi:hypothetical protein